MDYIIRSRLSVNILDEPKRDLLQKALRSIILAEENPPVSITPETIHHHLTHLPQRRSLDAALELFDALGYQYADEVPLPIHNWPAGVPRLVRRNAEPPIYLVQHRDFRVVYTYLTTDRLSRTVEQPIVEQTLHKLNPYALLVFANRDLTLWDFVDVKYIAEDGARRRTIRRIHVGPTERLHTAPSVWPCWPKCYLELQNARV